MYESSAYMTPHLRFSSHDNVELPINMAGKWVKNNVEAPKIVTSGAAPPTHRLFTFFLFP
jgi:hypothetical protein